MLASSGVLYHQSFHLVNGYHRNKTMPEDCVSSSTRRTLARLPVETLTEVAARLDFEDLARLKQCSIDLSQSLHNEALHRSSVQVRMGYCSIKFNPSLLTHRVVECFIYT